MFLVPRISHWYPSVSILFQTKIEVVWKVLDPVTCGWSTATLLQSGFRLFSFVNVVGHDGVVICHPNFSLEIVTVQHAWDRRWVFSVLSSHSWQASVSWLLASLRLCVGHSQQGFVVSLAHWDSASNMSVVIQYYSYEFAVMEFDGNTDPITTVGTWLEIVPHCPSITSTSIALALSPEPLVQLSLVQASRLVYALQYS